MEVGDKSSGASIPVLVVHDGSVFVASRVEQRVGVQENGLDPLEYVIALAAQACSECFVYVLSKFIRGVLGLERVDGVRVDGALDEGQDLGHDDLHGGCVWVEDVPGLAHGLEEFEEEPVALVSG